MSRSGVAVNQVPNPFVINGTTHNTGIKVDGAGVVQYTFDAGLLFQFTTALSLGQIYGHWQPSNNGGLNLGGIANRWANLYTNGIVVPITTQTGAAYNVAVGDNLVIINNAAATVTLLDPTTVIVGREYTVKNINAASATVVSAGVTKTIDGAASVTLTQWQRIQVVSDGTQWLVVSS